ncbi:MAG TPA: hypothetical protein DEP53_20060 [Bacteroidetes bacterium]|nr:hypothetical protein [Bacteroidota bacterium]
MTSDGVYRLLKYKKMSHKVTKPPSLSSEMTPFSQNRVFEFRPFVSLCLSGKNIWFFRILLDLFDDEKKSVAWASRSFMMRVLAPLTKWLDRASP